MKPLKAFVAASLLTAVTMAPALSTRALDAPEKSIGKDTALVVWLDFELFDDTMIKKIGEGIAEMAANPLVAQQGVGLPLGELNESVQKLTGFRNGFVEAGGQGLMMTLQMPEGESWSPPMALLAKTKGDVDAKAMRELVKKTSDGEMDAELAQLSKGWHNLSMVSSEGDEVTMALPEPDRDAFKSFDAQLGEFKKPLITVAFRMQDSMREQFNGMLDQGAAQGQQQDPMAAMAAGMLKPLKSIDTLGFAVSGDAEDYEIDVQMVFLNANDAGQFAQTYNALLGFVPALLAGQLQGVEDAPDPNKLNKFFMAMQMKHNGKALKLNLDKDFFDLAEELRPFFEQMAPQGGGDIEFEEEEAEEVPAA